MALVLAALVGTFGAVGVIRAANDRTGAVQRIEGLEPS
jgi:hypothetical protein